MDWFKGNPQDTIDFPMGVGDGRMVLWHGGDGGMGRYGYGEIRKIGLGE